MIYRRIFCDMEGFCCHPELFKFLDGSSRRVVDGFDFYNSVETSFPFDPRLRAKDYSLNERFFRITINILKIVTI